MSATLVHTPPTYDATTTPLVWGPVRKIGFRFLFGYLVLFGLSCLDFAVVISSFSLTGQFRPTPVDGFWGVVVTFVARHLLMLSDFKYQAYTSGDSPSDYVQLLTYVLIAVLVAAAWSLRDRKTPNYSRLSQWLRLSAQLALGVTLLSYGLDKVIPEQFGLLTPGRLLSRVGNLTPFLMLWSFMASSKAYTIFSGSLEVLAGLMLMTPKLKSIGALLAIAVLTNVFALNVFYDVPVKLFSLQLLLVAIYLAAPEFPRLIDALVLNRPVEPRAEPPLADNKAVARWAQLTQSGLAVAFFIVLLVGTSHRYAGEVAAIRTAPLAGIWEVDDFKTGSSAPLLTTKVVDELRTAGENMRAGDDHWSKLIIGSQSRGALQLQNGVMDYVALSINKDRTQLELSDPDDPAWKSHFTIHQQGPKLLTLQGVLNNVPVEVTLHAREMGFPLTSGTFHLVNHNP